MPTVRNRRKPSAKPGDALSVAQDLKRCSQKKFSPRDRSRVVVIPGWQPEPRSHTNTRFALPLDSSYIRFGLRSRLEGFGRRSGIYPHSRRNLFAVCKKRHFLEREPLVVAAVRIRRPHYQSMQRENRSRAQLPKSPCPGGGAGVRPGSTHTDGSSTD